MRQYKNKIGYRLRTIGYGLWLLPIAYCLSPIACLNAFAGDKAVIDTSQPITITSNSMEGRKKENMVIFRDNVVAVQKDYTLYSKELHVYYGDGNEIKDMIATGNVKIVQLNKTATGEKAVYAKANRTLVLTGNPQVEQDCDIVKGNKITIFLDEDKSLVEGSVKVIVHPKDKKTGGKNKAKCK